MQTGTADLTNITPEIYLPLARTKLAQFINFALFGIVDMLPCGPGLIVPVPSWKELSGDIEVIPDNWDPQINKITATKDVAVIRHLGKVFGGDDLARIVNGLNPNTAIADGIANYFAKEAVQKSFLSILKGLFNSTGGILYTTNRYSQYADVAATAATYVPMSPAVATDGMLKLGDQYENIIAWVMHSKVKGDLGKQGYLTAMTNTAPVGFNGDGNVELFLKRPIIMADSCPTTSGATTTSYRTFGISRGAFVMLTQNALNPEQDRDKRKKLDFLSTDLHAAFHVRGTAYAGTTGSGHPTATELETGASWTLAAESEKNVGVIAIDTN
jgi:hypothetical protein